MERGNKVNWIPFTGNLDQEYSALKESRKIWFYPVRSAIFSAILFAFSFLGLGITTDLSSDIMFYFIVVVKLLVFIIGIWFHFANFYVLNFQRKKRKSIPFWISLSIALASLGYFFFVAYYVFGDLISHFY